MNKKLLIGIAVAAIVAVGGVSLVATSAGGGPKGAYTFETTVVEKGAVRRIISASGAVQPLKKVDIGSEVSGKITKMYVDFNSKVTTGQVLAQIDPETYQNQLDQAQARLLQSKASVDNSAASIERAKVALETAESNYKRQKTLFDQQAISQSAWEQADQTYKNAKLQLTTEQVSLTSSQAGLKQSQAAVQDARLKLERTKILSPIDGVIINRKVDIGQTVQSSMNVAQFFTVAEDLSKIQIEAAVVESDIGGIEAGDPARFTVDAFPGQTFQGAVTQVRVQGAEQANVVTYTVVVQAPNPGGKLLPGMTANVEITADQAENTLRIADLATKFQPPKEIMEKLNGGRSNGQRPGGQGGAPGGFGGGAPGGGQMAAMGGGGQAGGILGASGGGQRPQGGQGGQGGNRGGGQGGQGGGNRGGGQGGPGGGNNMQAEMLKEIGVDDARATKIQTELQAEMEKARASMPQQPQQQGGGGALGGAGNFRGGPPPGMMQQQAMNEMRSKMQQAQEGVFRRNLNDEEYAKYEARRSEMQNQKRATVYVVNAKGELERKSLTIGLSDGSYAQIIRGAAEGDKFVIRAVSNNKSAPKKS